MKILPTIDYPEDLKRLPRADLEGLCEEIREFLVDHVSASGGHLSSNLGVVELTVALHYIFDIGPEKDRLVFDVSHQAYVHKILTGRRDRFPTLRKTDGLCGFTSQYESPYDLYHVSHAGTAVSTAMGYAMGRAHAEKEPGRVIALVGDAGIGAGMAFEALNHAGDLPDQDMLVVLNDNQMSISASVGALVRYFDKVRASDRWAGLKHDINQALEAIPVVGTPLSKWIPRVKEALHHYLNPGLIFEELGFRYFGPVDGHDVQRLISTLRDLKDAHGPVFLHVVTNKGHGYEPARKDPSGYHGVSGRKKAVEPTLVKGPAEPPPPSTAVCHKHFGPVLTRLAREDERIVAITAAMPSGTGLATFAEELPDRYYDVGICEQHAVAFAGGLATGGALPVTAIYSTFLQRGYDQVVHDVALQSAHVVVCMDRAGVVGGDGMTANGAFDIAFLRAVPNTTLLAPADLAEMEAMLRFALGHRGLVALRWPKAAFHLESLPGNEAAVRLGRSVRLREGQDLALLAYGAMVEPCLEAARQLSERGIEATVVNARFAKPLDVAAVVDAAQRFPLVVTVEDHALQGGFGSAVCECVSDRATGAARLVRLGLPDRFIEHGSRSDLLRRYGLGPAEIADRCETEVKRTVRTP
ncbi:MAG: 1-deoxy-D-xylulose-5-phosphate synthase [Planctomycetota bacterium]|jgi:1-deoxy-D-xylulose-5-phosphate synthase